MESPIQSELADDGIAVITLLGEIDFSNADEVADGIRDAIGEWSPSAVRIDLHAATFIDSTGLGALIEGYQAADAGDVDFAVVNPSDTFRRVLTVTGLCELFGLGEQAAADAERVSRTGA